MLDKIIKFVFFLVIVCAVSSAAFAVQESEAVDCLALDIGALKNMVSERTKGFKDLTMTAVVTYKNKRALAKVEESFTRLYEFKTAKILVKAPDKIRTEGKLGMVSFTYIVNGTSRIVRVPSIRINKKDDYKEEPSKVQDLLDIGILTSEAWKIRQPSLCTDEESAAKGQIVINAAYPNNTMQNRFWIDSKNLSLTRFEKRDPEGRLTIRLEYSKPKLFNNLIWLPTVVEIFAPDGEKAGAMELKDIKVNSGLSDSLFE